MKLTREQEAVLEGIRVKARVRHEKARKTAKKAGRKDFPDLPYECSWAFETQWLRDNMG